MHFGVTYLISACYMTHGVIKRSLKSVHKITFYGVYGIFTLSMAAIFKIFYL